MRHVSPYVHLTGRLSHCRHHVARPATTLETAHVQKQLLPTLTSFVPRAAAAAPCSPRWLSWITDHLPHAGNYQHLPRRLRHRWRTYALKYGAEFVPGMGGADSLGSAVTAALAASSSSKGAAAGSAAQSD